MVVDQHIYPYLDLCLSSFLPRQLCFFLAVCVHGDEDTPSITLSVQGLLDLPVCPPSLPPSLQSLLYLSDRPNLQQHVEPSRKAENKHCAPSRSHGELAALSDHRGQKGLHVVILVTH